MHHSADPLFLAIFDQMAEPGIVVKPNTPDFTIVTFNKAYANATGYLPEDLADGSLWEFFKSDTASTNVRKVFEEGLNDALRHQTEIRLPIFRLDIAGTSLAKAKPRWWQVDILPVMGTDGDVTYLACTTRNVTLHIEDQTSILTSNQNEAAMLVRQQESEERAGGLQESLDTANRDMEENITERIRSSSESEYRLKRVIAATPSGLSIIKRKDLLIETVNQPLLTLWGRKAADIINKPLLEVFPEMAGQPFSELLLQVLDQKSTMTLTAQPLIIIRADGTPVTRHADISFDPLFDVNGMVDAVLVTVSDVTEMIKAQSLLQNRNEELEAMNEEMAASNEEIQSINEEYEASNEELTAINEELRQTDETTQASMVELEDTDEYFNQAMNSADLCIWQQNPDDQSIK